MITASLMKIALFLSSTILYLFPEHNIADSNFGLAIKWFFETAYKMNEYLPIDTAIYYFLAYITIEFVLFNTRFLKWIGIQARIIKPTK